MLVVSIYDSVDNIIMKKSLNVQKFALVCVKEINGGRLLFMHDIEEYDFIVIRHLLNLGSYAIADGSMAVVRNSVFCLLVLDDLFLYVFIPIAFEFLKLVVVEVFLISVIFLFCI